MKRAMQKQTSLFLFLLGTASFSLSTLPQGHKKKDSAYTVISFSSNSEFASTCDDVSDQIDGGATSNLTCTVIPISVDDDSLRYIKSDGKADLVTLNHRTNPKDFNEMHPQQNFNWEVTTVCDGKDCPGGSANTIKKRGTVKVENFKQLTAAMNAASKNSIAEMADRKKAQIQANKKQDEITKRVAKCEINKDEDKLSAKQRLNCQIKKLDKMDDDKAADYFDENVRPEVERLLGSNNPAQIKQGMQIIQKMHDQGLGGDFVQDSIQDLTQYGAFNQQANQLRTQIARLAPNDPRRQQYQALMNQDKALADSYFHARTDQVGMDDWSTGANGFDYGSTLVNNLADFQSRIDQNYASILEQQRQMITGTYHPVGPNGQPLPAPAANTDPRALRAPMTSLPPPNQPWPTQANGAPVAANMPAPAMNKAAPVAAKAAATGIPHAGTQVH
jgi:hypothetical protein